MSYNTYYNNPRYYNQYEFDLYGYGQHPASRFKATRTSQPKRSPITSSSTTERSRYYSDDDRGCFGPWSFEAKFFANILFIILMLWTLTHLQFLQQGMQDMHVSISYKVILILCFFHRISRMVICIVNISFCSWFEW